MHQLRNNQFKATETVQQAFTCTPSGGVTKDEIMEPTFWAAVCSGVQPFAIIQVMPEDSSFYARLLVRSVGPSSLKVFMLEYHDLDVAVEEPEAPAYTVGWAGPSAKYRVTRTVDKRVMIDGFVTKDEANTWISEQMKALSHGKARAA